MRIKVKIFAYLLIFCALLIGLLWLFQVVFLDDIYKAIKVAEIKSDMKQLTENLGGENLIPLAAHMVSTQDITVEIHGSKSGQALYTTAQTVQGKQRISDFERARLFLKAYDNGGEYLEYPQSGTAEADPFSALFSAYQRLPEDILYSRIVPRENEDFFIILRATVTPVGATVNTLRIELYFITGFMIIFSVLIASLIARHVSKPIVTLNRAAKVLATGDYDTVFDANGYREIDELSGTLNQAARELGKVEGLRRELIANISHDLRTPLTMITGYAEAMRDLPGENNAENAQVIVDEGKRLTTLVNDVLDISKLQAGAQRLEPARFCLTESLRATILRLAEFTRSEGYTIAFEACENVEVSADEVKIMQAFYNLLTNAIQFTGENRTVTVRQTATPDAVRVEVSDSGKGISDEDLPYIWDRYYRTGQKHKRAAVGTGIGLSIVKTIMEMHGAAYGVDTQKDLGTTFWFVLKR